MSIYIYIYILTLQCDSTTIERFHDKLGFYVYGEVRPLWLSVYAKFFIVKLSMSLFKCFVIYIFY